MDFIKETNLNGLLETLDLYSYIYKSKGIKPPYLLKIPKRIWDKANEKYGIHNILSNFRRNEIIGVDIFTSYGVKKVRIWL